MSETEKLSRAIDALREKIIGGWGDLDSRKLTLYERRSLRERIKSCIDALKVLLDRLDETEVENGQGPR